MATSKTIEKLKKQFEGKDYVKFNLPECEIVWPHFTTPDDRFGSPGKFKGNFILPDDLAAEMAAVGFNIKDEKVPEKDADGNVILNSEGKPANYVITGRKFIQPTRKEAFGPPKVTAAGKPYTAEPGNGSRGTAKVEAKFMEVGGRTLLPIYLVEVDIVDLVEYEGSSDDGSGSSGGEYKDLF